MSGRLDGRVALVTGGSRGIGRAIAAAFVREGARVVITSRKADGLAESVAAIHEQTGERVVAVACHVGKPDAIATLFDFIDAEAGRVDVLVNNAGTNVYFGPLIATPWAAWDKTFEVNLKGAFTMSQHVAQRLIDQGKPGSVINIASVLGQRSAVMQGVYGMTKAALISMTQTFAHELGSSQIRFNAIAPGFTDTRLAAALTSNDMTREMIEKRTALGRIAQPEEVAGLAVFLASDESSYVTGEVFTVDGGYLSA